MAWVQKLAWYDCVSPLGIEDDMTLEIISAAF